MIIDYIYIIYIYISIIYIYIYNIYIYISIIYIYISNIYIYMYTYMYDIHHWRIFEAAIESWHSSYRKSEIWTHDHWIPFRRYNRLSHQIMSSTPTQSQLCRATSISSLFLSNVHISFLPLPSSVATFALSEISQK